MATNYKNITMNKRQYELACLMEGALEGDKRDTDKFFEAMTTSDHPALLVPAINKRVQDEAAAIPSRWREVASTQLVDDFRLQEIVRPRMTDGNILPKNVGKTFVEGGLPKIGELGEYPTISMDATGYQFRIAKSGVKAALSWEEVINGRSIGILDRFITNFATRAARQEGFEAFLQFVTGTGLNTTNLTDGTNGTNDALLAGNPALSRAGLKAALAQAATHRLDGFRISMPAKFNLVVSPTNEVEAREILSAIEIRETSTSGSVETISRNDLASKFDLVVADEIVQINDSADDFWFIVPKPGAIADANASVAFLRGYEAPQVFVKDTTVQNPMDGDFDHDAIETKVRHTASGVWSGAYGVVASTGAGS